MQIQDALPPLLGGSLIGASASLMLIASGEIAGISGILSGALKEPRAEGGWRLAFLAGLLVAGAGAAVVAPALVANAVPRPLLVVALAGLLVGFGTRLGSGCTSGHGVCGISRLSPRSLVATLTFISAGVVTVWLSRLVGLG
jgi:uncharacterized membrane protein YedE/YeeE